MISLSQFSLNINDQLICHELNLNIYPGQIWGILGPNGCGKTTFLHAIARLHAYQGKIRIENQSIESFTAREFAKKVGILLQNNSHAFLQTCWEYCAGGRFPHLNYFSKNETQDYLIIENALKQMGLYHYRHKKLNQLSGGEKRRLSMATLLTQNPNIYLLDEPTNHLDLNYQITVLNHFKQLAKEKSAVILMTLHDVNLAQQFCDHILMLFPNGKLSHGKTEEQLTAHNLSELYQHPFYLIKHNEMSFWQINATLKV